MGEFECFVPGSFYDILSEYKQTKKQIDVAELFKFPLSICCYETYPWDLSNNWSTQLLPY